MIVGHEILKQIRQQVIDYVDLTGDGSVRGIPDENVVVIFPHEKRDRDDATPGLVIAPAKRVVVPPDEGVNCQDDVYYSYLIQIIDRQDSDYDDDRMACLYKWAQNIRRHFNHQNLRLKVFETDGYVNRVLTEEHATYDSDLFYSHRLCVFAVQVTVVAREPRSDNGSV